MPPCLPEPASVGSGTGDAGSLRRGAGERPPAMGRGMAAGERSLPREGRVNKRVTSLSLPDLPYWAMF